MKPSFLGLQVLAAGVTGFLIANVLFQMPKEDREVHEVDEETVLTLPLFEPPSGAVSSLMQRYPQKKKQTTEQARFKRKPVKQWKLCGIVQEGRQRYALIEQGGQLLRLNVGDAVSTGESIVEVKETGVTLKGDGGERVVLLYEMRSR